jgi:hypothetical protein
VSPGETTNLIELGGRPVDELALRLSARIDETDTGCHQPRLRLEAQKPEHGHHRLGGSIEQGLVVDRHDLSRFSIETISATRSA